MEAVHNYALSLPLFQNQAGDVPLLIDMNSVTAQIIDQFVQDGMTSFVGGVAGAVVGMSAECALGNSAVWKAGEEDSHVF